MSSPPPPPPSAPSPVDVVAGEGWRPRIGEWLSFEASTIVHATLILVLAMFTSERAAERTVQLLAAPFAEPVLLDEPQPIATVEMQSTEETLAPAPQEAVFEPAAESDDAPPGPENIEIGEVGVPDPTGLPLGAALLMGGGAAGRSGNLHGREDLAVFAKRLTKAKAKSGDVQISLIWNNLNDLDLHVITPAGERICYFQRLSRCRGMLDVDMNAGGRMTKEPVENVFWARGAAPYGEYVVTVDHFNNNDQPDPTSFEVLVQVDGDLKRFHQKITFGQEPIEVYRFHRYRGGRIESPNDDFPL